jgi:U3 small nucleolar RNA-associated protein 18
MCGTFGKHLGEWLFLFTWRLVAVIFCMRRPLTACLIVLAHSCVQRFKHDDGTGTQTLAVNPHLGGMLAVGAESGVVSIYQSGARESRLATTHQKMKSILNLTTVIDNLTFAPDGQMLAMGSSQKKDALKLVSPHLRFHWWYALPAAYLTICLVGMQVHLPSCTVYQNWPTDKTPLKRPTSLTFSPGGGALPVRVQL